MTRTAFNATRRRGIGPCGHSLAQRQDRDLDGQSEIHQKDAFAGAKENIGNGNVRAPMSARIIWHGGLLVRLRPTPDKQP